MNLLRLVVAMIAFSVAAAGDTSAPKATCTSVFPHGEGRGEMSAGTHALLERERANEIIVDELARAGIATHADGAALPSVQRKVELRLYLDRATQERLHMMHTTELRDEPLTVGGRDAARSIGWVYVDRWLHGELQRGASRWDFRALAESVARRAVADAAVVRHLAVFYDPLVPMQECKGKDCSGAAAEAELRAQVRDFVACLRRRGALDAAAPPRR